MMATKNNLSKHLAWFKATQPNIPAPALGVIPASKLNSPSAPPLSLVAETFIDLTSPQSTPDKKASVLIRGSPPGYKRTSSEISLTPARPQKRRREIPQEDAFDIADIDDFREEEITQKSNLEDVIPICYDEDEVQEQEARDAGEDDAMNERYGRTPKEAWDVDDEAIFDAFESSHELFVTPEARRPPKSRTTVPETPLRPRYEEGPQVVVPHLPHVQQRTQYNEPPQRSIPGPPPVRPAPPATIQHTKSVRPEPAASLFSYKWSNDVKEVLKQTFRLNGFRQNQLEAINATLGGKNAFVLMPTGGGKSLCYQLPSVISSGATRGITIVVSPLLSLMQDQVDHLKALRIKAYLINGETPGDEKKEIMSWLRSDNVSDHLQLLYVTPEMMTKNQALISILSKLSQRKQFARIVIDEAHCVSQWGHDFRPDYKAIGELKRQFIGVPTIALTATATENVKLDVMHNLGMQGCEVFTQSFNRANLTYTVFDKPKVASQLLEDMATLIQSKFKNQTGIIYCLSRQNCENVAEGLRKQFQIKARHYHAGMETAEKTRTQTDWQAGRVKVIVATIAFGMGIDKADVRFVIHYTVPKSLEGYYQETGRAGRDNNPSACFLFYGQKDTTTLKRMIFDGDGSREQKDRQMDMLQRMISYCENKSDCRRAQVLGYFSEKFNRTECRQTCDNCKSDVIYEKRDMTELAKSAVKVVQQIQAVNATLLLCVEVFRGGRSKKIADNNFDQSPAYGSGKELDKSSAERLFYRLIQTRVLEEVTVYNAAGFPQPYVKVGYTHGLLGGSQRIVLDIRKSGSKTQKSTTANIEKVPKQNSRWKKKKEVLPHTGVGMKRGAGSFKARPQSTTILTLDPIDLDDDDDNDKNDYEEYTTINAASPDFEPADPQQLELSAQVESLRQDAIETFVIDIVTRMKSLSDGGKLNGSTPSAETWREMWTAKPQTEDDLKAFMGVTEEIVVLLGYEIVARIRDSKGLWERNRDDILRNTVRVV